MPAHLWCPFPGWLCQLWAKVTEKSPCPFLGHRTDSKTPLIKAIYLDNPGKILVQNWGEEHGAEVLVENVPALLPPDLRRDVIK